MKIGIELELIDVYGGDGEVRMVREQETKLKRTKKKTEMRADIGLPVSDSETEEQSIQEVEREIQTFRRDEDGCPIMRLGGAHGKIYGALKSSASALRISGVSPFKSGYLTILNSLIISPVWARLEMEKGTEVQVQRLPQVLSGVKRTMIVQKFDSIPKCRAELMLTFPDAMDDAVEKMVRGLENVSMLNKRRATAKVVRYEQV